MAAYLLLLLPHQGLLLTNSIMLLGIIPTNFNKARLHQKDMDAPPASKATPESAHIEKSNMLQVPRHPPRMRTLRHRLSCP